MRKNQWNVLGFAFLLLVIYFIYLDATWENLCNLYDIEKPLDKLYPLRCIQTEIFEPFIYIFFVMWTVCWINAWIEGRAEKKEEKERDDELWRDTKEKDFVMKVAQKLNLEHLPQDIPELVFWGKKEGKEKEVDKAVKEWAEIITGRKNIPMSM